MFEQISFCIHRVLYIRNNPILFIAVLLLFELILTSLRVFSAFNAWRVTWCAPSPHVHLVKYFTFHLLLLWMKILCFHRNLYFWGTMFTLAFRIHWVISLSSLFAGPNTLPSTYLLKGDLLFSNENSTNHTIHTCIYWICLHSPQWWQCGRSKHVV